MNEPNRLLDSVEQKLLDNGQIFLFGDIEEPLSLEILKQLEYLHLRRKKRINLYINSNGGCPDCAYSIVDKIQELIEKRYIINTIVCGKAYSAGGIVLAYGKMRYATANSTIMLHPSSYEMGPDYSKFQKKYTDFFSKFEDEAIQKLAIRCGHKTKRDREIFAARVSESLWLTAQEAITMGVIDKIWNDNK